MPQRNTVDATLTPANPSFAGKEGHYGNDDHNPEFEAIKVGVATKSETMNYVHGGENKIVATDAFITEVTIGRLADATLSIDEPQSITGTDLVLKAGTYQASKTVTATTTEGYEFADSKSTGVAVSLTPHAKVEGNEEVDAGRTYEKTVTIGRGWNPEDYSITFKHTAKEGSVGEIVLDEATGELSLDITEGYIAGGERTLTLDAQTKVEGKSSDTGRSFSETVTIGKGYNAEAYDITFSHTAQAGSVELGLPVNGVITPVVTEGYITEVAPIDLGVSNFSMGEGASFTSADLVEGEKWTVSHSITASATAGIARIKKCFQLIPPITSIIIITIPIHIVTLIFGSSITSKHTAPPERSIGKIPLNVFVLE